MKYLEMPRLTVLTSFLDEKELGDLVLRGRVEAFSCKSAGKDKKLAKMLQRRYVNELEATSDELQGVMSPLGPMSSVSTRKLLINLIATMNASFPDFDFSSLSADEFRSEEMTIVVNAINTRLAAPIEHDSPGFTEELWSSLNHTITLKDCVVYSYVADLDSDPLSCGSLWSFNYFFYNATLARIVYFTVVAQTGSRVMARGGMASPGAMSHEAHFGGSQHHGSSASAHAHAAPSPGVSSPLQKRRRTLDGAVSTGAASASGADDDMVDRDRSSAGEEVDLGAYRSTNTGAMWEKNEIRIRADAS